MNRRRSKRAGTMLVVVLACLSLVLALTIAALQTALRMRREVRKQHLVSQTSLLCETGLARAAHRHLDPNYSGETWLPPLPEFPGKQGEVSIVFLERTPNRSTVQVTAVLEDVETKNNRVQRTLTTNLLINKSLSDLQSELPRGKIP